MWHNMKKILKKNDMVCYFYRCLQNSRDKNEFYAIAHPESFKNRFDILSYGKKNRDKVIYYINQDGQDCGFFALYRHILLALYAAERFHFIPYMNISHSDYNDAGKEDHNIFDCYFEQPSGLTREEVLDSYNVVVFHYSHVLWIQNEYMPDNRHFDGIVASYEVTSEYIMELARLKKKYIQLKPEIEKRINHDILNLIKGEKVIALHFRGNAYGVGFYGHPVGLDVEDYYPYIDECIQSGYEKFFLATDDARAISKFKRKYPKKFIYYMDLARSSNGLDVHEQHIKRENNGFLMGYEVLRDMHTMACCEGLICGNSQVTFAARIEKISRGEKFKYLKIIDKGLNEKEKSAFVRKYRKELAEKRRK